MGYRLTVDMIRTGQPRPYADHEDVYHFMVETHAFEPGKGYSKELTPTVTDQSEYMKMWAKKVATWYEKPSAEATPSQFTEWHFMPHLKHLQPVKNKPGWWELFITTAYTG